MLFPGFIVHHSTQISDLHIHTWPRKGFHQSYVKIAGTILNCHTCAYMNDQGKCLRGEGTCTTEKSQQCMLKKIFEGENTSDNLSSNRLTEAKRLRRGIKKIGD